MCGIIAYLGDQNAYPILMEGLKRLEYRGYDSAGIALLDGDLEIYKKKGKVQELCDYTDSKSLSGTLGMGHTRWATHGKPDDINAHPHVSGDGKLAIIHNGIIENYGTLKEALTRLGHQFRSETDTEVLIHLIEEIKKREQLPIEEAVRKALRKVVGAYAIVVMDKDEPNKLVGARKSSPLVIGLGEHENFIASDATPIIQYTNRVVYLNDEEIAVLTREKGLEISTISNDELQEPTIHELDMSMDQLEKSGFEHFMLKEIYQQPQTISDCMRGRLNATEGWVRLGGLEEHINRISKANRIIIAACGTSWHSALIGEYLIEELARIPVEVEYASEFRYRNPILTEHDVVVVISQSGETADTLAAAELAKEKGALVYGIVNVVGSSIARLTHAGSYIHCGPEIGVASTKAFTGQVTLLSLMALVLGHRNGAISNSYYHQLIAELASIPDKVTRSLQLNDQIKYLATEIQSVNALYLGRGYNFPVALEGALKLKEISYIHAEGYPAAEMKHGPIALIDENMPVIFIATNVNSYEKIISNIQEVKARKGIVIAIVKEGDQEITKMADHCIEIPETIDPLTPLLSVIPLQLLSYHIAVLRGCDVDQPRNLAKSVTVE